MAWRMSQRDENLARSCRCQADIIFHDRITAAIAMFFPQTFKNPLRRVPLFRSAVLSNSRIASITGTGALSFGRSGGFELT